jgi:uncharacterized protein YndB with AHSA1/START domain
MATDGLSRRLDIAGVGDRQIVMTRGFAAPPLLVFDALVTPSCCCSGCTARPDGGWWSAISTQPRVAGTGTGGTGRSLLADHHQGAQR